MKGAVYDAPDPEFPQSWNAYSYANNQPLMNVDPLGLEWACVGVNGNKPDCKWFNDPGPGGGGVGGGPGGGPSGGCGPATLFTGGTIFADDDCGGGGGGGGGQVGAGGSPVPPAPPAPPSIWTRFKGWFSQELACTDNFADKVSIAGGLHKLGIGNGGGVGTLIANALAGNVLSGFIEAAQHHSRAQSAALLAGSGAGLGVLHGGPVEEGVGGEVMKYAARAAWSSVTGAGETITTLAGEASLASTGVTAASFATGVGYIKLGYDVASWVISGLSCLGN